MVALNSGHGAYKFNNEKVPPQMEKEIKTLNLFLYKKSLEYINSQLAKKDFSLDFGFFNNEFQNFNSAIIKSKWNNPKTNSLKHKLFGLLSSLKTKKEK
jgi:hypothetical protein